MDMENANGSDNDLYIGMTLSGDIIFGLETSRQFAITASIKCLLLRVWVLLRGYVYI